MSDKVNILLEVSKVDGSVKVTTNPPTPPTVSSVESSQVSPVKYDKVFVYDINDMTMLSKKRIERIKKERPKIPVNLLSDKMEEILKRIDLTDSNEFEGTVSIKNLKNHSIDDKLANYGNLKEFYDMTTNWIRILGTETMDNEKKGLAVFADRWKCVNQCLQLVNKRSDESQSVKYANVVLTEDGIAHGAVQMLMSELAPEVRIENIFSKSVRSTESVLKKLQKKFGEQCKLVIVSSNPDTMNAARKLLLPTWPIFCNEDFDELHCYQRDFWVPTQQKPELMKEDESKTQVQAKNESQRITITQKVFLQVRGQNGQVLQQPSLMTDNGGPGSTFVFKNLKPKEQQDMAAKNESQDRSQEGVSQVRVQNEQIAHQSSLMTDNRGPESTFVLESSQPKQKQDETAMNESQDQSQKEASQVLAQNEQMLQQPSLMTDNRGPGSTFVFKNLQPKQQQDKGAKNESQVRSQEDFSQVLAQNEQMLQKLSLMTDNHGPGSDFVFKNFQPKQQQFEYNQYNPHRMFRPNCGYKAKVFHDRLQYEKQIIDAQLKMKTQSGAQFDAQQEQAMKYSLFLISQKQQEMRGAKAHIHSAGAQKTQQA